MFNLLNSQPGPINLSASLILLCLSGLSFSVSAQPAEVEKEFINSNPSYTQVVTVVNGDVKTLYVSGQVGSRDGGVPESFAEQIDVVFANMQAQLEAAGASMADVIKLNGYIVDIDRDKVTEYGQARSRYFSADDPAPGSTLVGVAGLVRDYFLVEVEAIAVIGVDDR